MKQMIYIHVPFCRHKCAYCDFVSGTNIGLKDRYISAVRKELALRDCQGEADTLYFGGGTPSMLPVEDINQLYDILSERFDFSGLSEWTVECNPEDMTSDWLCGLRKAGVNRLSVGVQSLDDEQLRWMERRHSASDALDAVRRAQSAGFSNISCDLIYGAPGNDALGKTLEGIIDLGVQHISAYSLMMEEGSKLTKKGIHGIDEETSAVMYRLIVERLHEAGYQHYEISNWALPGFSSRHNSGYWSGRSYIGLGPGAHSFDGLSMRRWNIGNTLKYCKLLENGGKFWDGETLSLDDRFNEMVMLGLRTSNGVDLQSMEKSFGSDKRLRFERAMRKFGGLVVFSDERCALTEEGFFVSDMIMSDGFM